MENIYSKVEKDLLLHFVFRLSDFDRGRENLINQNEYLQCSALQLKAGTTFKPHKHIMRDVMEANKIVQESWHVISGSVKCTFYDLDDSIIAEPILYQGDTSFTLRGGHTYTILEDDTIVLEYKTGKYYGQELDKTFI